MTDDLYPLVECDRCGEKSESGWGDTEYCTDCEDRSQVCHIHLRTFYFDEGCSLCQLYPEHTVDMGKFDV